MEDCILGDEVWQKRKGRVEKNGERKQNGRE